MIKIHVANKKEFVLLSLESIPVGGEWGWRGGSPTLGATMFNALFNLISA